MTKPSPEERKLASVARRYKRNGYRVSVPATGVAGPAFLGGYLPALIAESDQDRVVVEVKRSDQVRQSNDLLELAERMSNVDGWRFELVTVPPPPDFALTSPDQIDRMAARARQALGLGLADVAYTHAWCAVEILISALSSRTGARPLGASVPHLARNLASEGAISRKSFDVIEKAYAARAWIVHGDRDHDLAAGDVAQLLALVEELCADLATLGDAARSKRPG